MRRAEPALRNCKFMSDHKELMMSIVNLTVAKRRFNELIRKVESGEEAVITRHGRPVARVLPVSPVKQPVPLERLAELRKRLPTRKENSAKALRELRDAE